MTRKIVTEVNNNLWIDICPCCNSKSISAKGEINYALKTTFSNQRISLKKKPELWICNNCKSLFTQNRVLESSAIHLYSKGSSWSSGSFEGVKTKEVVYLINSLVKKDCKFLDVGCANGAMLDYVRSKGALTFGLEYSIFNRNKLEEKGHTAYTDWTQVNNEFDIITAFDVVEHLYDISSFLSSCLKRLSKDGVLVILTGNVHSLSAQISDKEWWYVRYPEHILFPSIEFFSSLPEFKILKTLKTYPGRFSRKEYSQPKNFIRNIKNVVRNIFSSIVRKDFSPSPFTQPDHVIIVLQKIL
jgi:2-polyprenyl-3-methyl-5-hydroxy-6-metoxy-1,4-benzoquinol methylase